MFTTISFFNIRCLGCIFLEKKELFSLLSYSFSQCWLTASGEITLTSVFQACTRRKIYLSHWCWDLVCVLKTETQRNSVSRRGRYNLQLCHWWLPADLSFIYLFCLMDVRENKYIKTTKHKVNPFWKKYIAGGLGSDKVFFKYLFFFTSNHLEHTFITFKVTGPQDLMPKKNI